MRKSPVTTEAPAEQVVKDIRRATRKLHSFEEKIRIMLSGLRGEDSISELCRREGIAQSLYYSWSNKFLETGKKRLAKQPARRSRTCAPSLWPSRRWWPTLQSVDRRKRVTVIAGLTRACAVMSHTISFGIFSAFADCAGSTCRSRRTTPCRIPRPTHAPASSSISQS
jgi:transposase